MHAQGFAVLDTNGRWTEQFGHLGGVRQGCRVLHGRRKERSRRGHRLLQRVREGAASSRDERLGIRVQRHGARRAQDPDAVEGPQGSGGPLRPPGLRDRWTTRAGSECFANSKGSFSVCSYGISSF